MAILIERNGNKRLVIPANGVSFSQEEIDLYCNHHGGVLFGDDREMSRENRPAFMKQENSPNQSNLGSLRQMGDALVESFQKLKPDEQEQLRKECYERITGKSYRADGKDMSESKWKELRAKVTRLVAGKAKRKKQ